MDTKFNHTEIEKKWQDKWEKDNLYVADIDSCEKKPFYNLWMFPYPSAEGLHAGHAFASTGSDVYGRYMRMNGYEVFQPIGYDSFGIHSENYAIKINEDPHKVVMRTTRHYEEQMRSLGHGYDWTRTVTTSASEYYKWTQWLFMEMFKSGLAYKKSANVNFCPSCKTVLADEQVMTPKQAGKEPKDASGNQIPVTSISDDLRVCERCGTVAEKRELDQWFMRITDYADRLLSGLEKIDWSERVKLAQKEWIGKSEGMKIRFKIKDSDDTIDVFTTRPDTLDSATFMATWSVELASPEKTKEKLGKFTGKYAINPINGRDLPIWETNYVARDYGTGYVMGVPAYDERDLDFAKKYSIDILTESLNIDLWNKIEKENWGTKYTNYHLRDWLVSRQRYWGAPIPMIYCESCAQKGDGYLNTMGNVQGTTLRMLHKDHSDWKSEGFWPDENLPVLLPEMTEYKPDGSANGPLAHHPEFFNVKCPHCGAEARRETDVMDTFVDSSWYFLAYPNVGTKEWDIVPSAGSGQVFFDEKIMKTWLPVNLYFGGAEHSVLHLMYARFVNMVMYDKGLVGTEEPFPKFFAHGLMIKDGAKMSKSRGNVVNPDEYVKKFGADVMRMYVMFLGPMDGYPDFRDSGIEGMERFLSRVWRLFTASTIQPSSHPTIEGLSKLHQTIKGVTEDIKLFKYNTAIAKIMELVNLLTQLPVSDIEYLSILARLLAPFAPHMMEEVWVEILGQPFSIHKTQWPVYDPKMIVQNEVTIMVQINGKVRSQFTIDNVQGTNKEEVEKIAMTDAKVAKYLEGQTVKKVIFVAGKLVNFVL